MKDSYGFTIHGLGSFFWKFLASSLGYFDLTTDLFSIQKKQEELG